MKQSPEEGVVLCCDVLDSESGGHLRHRLSCFHILLMCGLFSSYFVQVNEHTVFFLTR